MHNAHLPIPRKGMSSLKDARAFFGLFLAILGGAFLGIGIALFMSSFRGLTVDFIMLDFTIGGTLLLASVIILKKGLSRDGKESR